jgi:lipopolysaccharide biosynthesis regulator YciM
MGAALVLLLVGLGAMAAGVLIGRYYVPDDRQLRRTARHSRSYMRALSHLIARDHETAVSELRTVVEENVEDAEPYFALGAMFRNRGEHERAIRVHQALAVRERDKRKLRQRAMYELGLDFRASGMPRRATRAMEEVLVQEPSHEGALRALAALYEEQARFNEAAGLWQRLGRRRGEDTSLREHHLLVAAAQAALGRDDLDSAKQLLKAAQKYDKHHESAHFLAAAAELAAARGNHRGAKERLRQALIVDPGLAHHLLPGLIAAEQGLLAQALAGDNARADDLDGEDFESDALEAEQLPAGAQRALPASISDAYAAASPAGASAVREAISEANREASPAQVHTVARAEPSMPVAAPPLAATRADAEASMLVAAPPVAATRADAEASMLVAAPPLVAAGEAVSAANREATASVSAASRGAATSMLTAAVPLGATGDAMSAADEGAAAGPAPAGSGGHVVAASGEAASPATSAIASQPLGAEYPTAAPNVGMHTMSIATAPRAASSAASTPVSERDNRSRAPGRETRRMPSVVASGVLAVLAEVEAQTGPRLELALIRAQLVPAGDAAARAALARELTVRFPEALAARVATARLALAGSDAGALRGALGALVADDGALAWALRGRWQCAHCGHRPGAFSWRCGQCRRWGTLRMETGIEPPPVPPRERRAAPRTARPDSLLGASPDEALPAPTLDPGLSDDELATAGVRRSLLGRVGGWITGVWRRDSS